MGIKGRRRTPAAEPREPSTAAARSHEKQQAHVCAVANNNSEADQHNEREKKASRAHIVAVQKRRAGVTVLRYSDGSRYEGQTATEVPSTSPHDGEEISTVTLLRHGKGVYVTHNGHVFDGEWELGVFQGFGSQTFARTGDRHEGLYHKNQRHGLGTYVWANGDKYVGNWRHGKIHGNGYFLWDHGDSYEGEWKRGVMHGKGRKICANGDLIGGEWRRNMVNGYGRKVFVVSGDVYEGCFAHDERSGYGTYTWANGDKHEGLWRDGLMHGTGVFSTSEGSTLQGQWWYGELHGHGVERFACGSVYAGGFKNALRSGVGVLTLVTGDVFEGEWVDDEIEGFGMYAARDGHTYVGAWTRGLPSGDGLFSRAHRGDDEDDEDGNAADEGFDGRLESGEFEDGVLQPCGSFRIEKLDIPSR